MKLTEISSQDFAQQYSNTYGFITKSNNEKALILISRIEEQDKVYFKTEDQEEWYAKFKNDKTEFTFPLPNKGFYLNNEETSVFYVQRRTDRQWQKGAGQGTLTLNLLDNQGRFRTSLFNFATMLPILSPSPIPLFNTEIFFNPRTVTLLSRKFCKAGRFLYGYSELIGEVKETHVEVLSSVVDIIKEHLPENIKVKVA